MSSTDVPLQNLIDILYTLLCPRIEKYYFSNFVKIIIYYFKESSMTTMKIRIVMHYEFKLKNSAADAARNVN